MAKEHDQYLPLFETKPAKFRVPFRIFTTTILAGVLSIFVYRLSHVPPISDEEATKLTIKRYAWIGTFLAELWFGLYWLVTLVVRWNPIHRQAFRDRLSLRYDEEVFPGVDVFVCTADPAAEPPSMVVSTVLSVMAYDYPSGKLSVYLSDDGCSDLMFYALLEASSFAGKWLPFCRKFKVEPRSPEAYFRRACHPQTGGADDFASHQWASMKKEYEDMKTRIDSTAKLGKISEEIRKQHKGFAEWDSVLSRHDHPTILHMIIDGRDPTAVDDEGQALPSLVYLAREKRPRFHHNFKAGAMNALIRVSSSISNAPIILNVDCDMYSNDSGAVRDAMCFFLDEERGHEFAFAQFPQAFENITKNDIYGNSLRVIMEVELRGMDGNGGCFYIGTGCFHRRECLMGKKYSKESASEVVDWKRNRNHRTKTQESQGVLEETSKALASCDYEHNTPWGKELGLMYGCLVEDLATGLAMQCRGWRSVYFCPERRCFLGSAPTTLLQTLVQHKRWAEGDLEILVYRSPLLLGYKKMPLMLQLSYFICGLWPPSCFASLYYASMPALCLLSGIALFPKISDPWVVPFIYVSIGNRVYGLVEALSVGMTFRQWVNDQRMWLFKRTTSYFFAFFDHVLKLLGFTKSTFVITAKVTDDDVAERYDQELIEFGVDSPMFTILTTLALINALGLVWGLKRLVFSGQRLALNPFALQAILCCLLVLINVPIYQAVLLRTDKGKMPASVTNRSIMAALVVCSLALYYSLWPTSTPL